MRAKDLVLQLYTHLHVPYNFLRFVYLLYPLSRSRERNKRSEASSTALHLQHARVVLATISKDSFHRRHRLVLVSHRSQMSSRKQSLCTPSDVQQQRKEHSEKCNYNFLTTLSLSLIMHGACDNHEQDKLCASPASCSRRKLSVGICPRAPSRAADLSSALRQQATQPLCDLLFWFKECSLHTSYQWSVLLNEV